MVIYYLQQKQTPVLPVLQEVCFVCIIIDNFSFVFKSCKMDNERREWKKENITSGLGSVKE